MPLNGQNHNRQPQFPNEGADVQAVYEDNHVAHRSPRRVAAVALDQSRTDSVLNKLNGIIPVDVETQDFDEARRDRLDTQNIDTGRMQAFLGNIASKAVGRE